MVEATGTCLPACVPSCMQWAGDAPGRKTRGQAPLRVATGVCYGSLRTSPHGISEDQAKLQNLPWE